MGNLKGAALKNREKDVRQSGDLKVKNLLLYYNGNKKQRELAEKLDEMVVELDLDGNIVYANKKVIEKTGYTEKELRRGFNIKQVVSPEEVYKAEKHFSGLLNGKKLTRSVYNITRKDGSVFPVITYPHYILDGDGEIIGVWELIVDITDFEEIKQKLVESEERYRTLFENSLDGIYRTTLDGKYIDANPALVSMLGYSSREELLKIDIPTQLYVRKKDRPSAAERNRIFETELKKKDGTVIMVEINSKVVSRKGKPAYYEGIVRDVTRRKVAEEKLRESYKKLKKTLNDIINTLTSIVEVRDPYTSGHQRRVAQLATAIAREMGLDRDRVESIRIAALIHDIGKINLPESILTRPGRLSEIEYDMIKTHSQLGHDMIKNVEFPWPVADFILQHHERLDGSGYPGGLKGKDITLEARILGVSDVVEAMASHRPYRPALGINKALEEINRGRGRLYDKRVVDACNRVIKEKNFKFKMGFKPYL